MSHLNLLACDLSFRSSVKYTYGRDDGLSRSWIDHIFFSQSFSSLVTDVCTTRSGCILSDHFPLLHLNCSPSPGLSFLSSSSLRINWSKATSFDSGNFWIRMAECLLAFPSDIASCTNPICSSHYAFLDDYAQHVIKFSSLCGCAFHCLPKSKTSSRKVVGWNENVGRLKDATNYWHRV